MKKAFCFLCLLCIGHFSFCQTHIILVYDGGNENVKLAVQKANELLNNPEFYKRIRQKANFDNTDPIHLTGNQIAEKIERATQQITIKRKNKPIANASTTVYNLIKISRQLFGIKKGKFDLAEAVNTLIHETVHAVDFLDDNDSFTHNGNKPDGQENTAPWVIGQIAEDMINEGL